MSRKKATATINLDDQIVQVTVAIYLSKTEVDSWPHGVNDLLMEKTETVRANLLLEAKKALRQRGWIE